MVTWPVVSTAVVLLAVGLMLVWYERQRPSARTVALVAAMAALAVVGRIAFAPIPNVKPTTDLVLLAGLAFGVVPGFAVGATTALVSNIVFGQGLHTPWQMLAWGGVGVLGALVARTLGPRRSTAAGGDLRGRGPRVRRLHGSLHLGDRGWSAHPGGIPCDCRAQPAVQPCPCRRQCIFALAFAPALLAALGRAAARSQVVIRPLPAARAAACWARSWWRWGAGGAVAAPRRRPPSARSTTCWRSRRLTAASA